MVTKNEAQMKKIRNFYKIPILLGLGILLIFSGCNKDDAPETKPLVSTSSVSDITQTSANLNGEVTNAGSSAVTTRGFAYSIETAPDIADLTVAAGSGTGNFNAVVSNLTANTTYFVRAYATNDVGTTYGNEVSFTTSPGAPMVTTMVATNVETFTAEVGGEVTNDGGHPVTDRGIVWSTEANPDMTDNVVAGGTGIGAFTITLVDLEPETTYYTKAYATNSIATTFGQEESFTTPAYTVSDVDGNVYGVIELCGQFWLTSNLKTTKYTNGDPLTDGSVTNFDWLNNTEGAFTYPNGEPTNNDHFGKLYNFEAIRDSRGVCPTGWHVATDTNWGELEVCYGMDPAEVYTGVTRTCPRAPELFEGGISGLDITKAGSLFFSSITGATQWNGFGSRGWYFTGTVRTSTTNWNRELNRLDDPTKIYRAGSGRSNIGAVRCVRD